MVSLRPVNREETLRYLGWRDGAPDAVMTGLMDESEQELLAACHPAYSYGVFDCQIAADGVHLSECALVLSGKDIAAHLAGCEKVVLLAVTLGAGVDALLRRLQIAHMPKAVITDAMAGAVLEQICDDIQRELALQFPAYRETWRFSPGYGDLPLEIQEDFLAVLEAGKRIGLCTTASHMLTPVKSVTAIIGLTALAGEVQIPVGGCGSNKGCAGCKAANCTMRKVENES